MQSLFFWILSRSLSSTIIIFIILLLRKMLKNKLGIKFTYALWFLVIFKLILPVDLESSLSVFNLFPKDNKTIDYMSQEGLIKDIEDYSISHNENSMQRSNIQKTSNIQKSIKLNIKNLLSIVWLLGFALTIFIYLSIIGRTIKIISGFEIVKDSNINRILESSKIKIGLNKNVLIITNDFFNSPFITGISNIKIYIPKKILEGMSEEKLTYIILHELLHCKNNDLLVNILQSFVTVIYWFNPFIWLAMRLMKEDRELARDYDVLKIIGKENSLSYGMTILEISEMFLNNSRSKILGTFFMEDNNNLRRRILMIKDFNKLTLSKLASGILMFIILGSSVLTSATGFDKGLIQNDLVQNHLIALSSNEFEIKDDIKVFVNSDRARGSVDFKFKLPSFIPKDNNFFRVILNENTNILKVDFEEKGDLSYELLISKDDLIDKIKDMYLINDSDILFNESKTNINGITGVELNILNKEGNCEESHFIWDMEGISYSLFNYKSNKEYREIEDIDKVINSFKDADEINYNSRLFNNFIIIYNNEDLIEAAKILGFTPKFPLNIDNKFEPIESKVYTSYFDNNSSNDLIGFINITTKFKDLESGESFNFKQIKNTGDHYNLNTMIAMDSIKQSNMKIKGHDIYCFKKINNDNGHMEEIYTWKIDDIVYEIIYRGRKVYDFETIIKSLI